METKKDFYEKNPSDFEGKEEIIYFNYLGIDVEHLSKFSKEKLLKILDGDSHAIIDGDLYVKLPREDKFAIKRKDFIKTDEGEFYKNLLSKE